MSEKTSSDAIPEAIPDVPRRAPWAIWLIPAAAAVIAGWLWLAALLERGPVLELVFASAHGLGVGDVLRHRGMEAGVVEAMDLDVAGGQVQVALRLRRDAVELAREGSRFWIERPILGVEGARGLETLIGGPHVAVLPGSGELVSRLRGLDHPPVRDPSLDDALELVLEAPRRGGLVPGAPVLYRQIPVGKVLACNLAVDGRTVEVRVAVAVQYAGLVQTATRFWQVGGIQLEAGLISGLELRIDSLSTLAQGGVAFATPGTRAEAVVTGHRFTLHAKPEADWLAWSPSLPVALAAGGGGMRAPRLERAAVSWTEGGWWRSQRRRSGWVLPLGPVVLGPADLLTRPLGEQLEDLRFELAGSSHPLDVEVIRHGPLAIREVPGVAASRPRVRVPEAVEDLVLIDGEGGEQVLSGARFHARDGLWALDSGVTLEAGWHGAVACSLADGAVIGVVVVDRAGAGVAPLTTALVGDLPFRQP